MSKSKKEISNCFESLYPLNIGLVFETFSRLEAKEIRISRPAWMYVGRGYRSRLFRANKKTHYEIKLDYDEFVSYVSNNINNLNIRDIGSLPSFNLDTILEKICIDNNNITKKNLTIFSILRSHVVSCLGSSISLGEPDKRVRGLIELFNKYKIEIYCLFYYIEYNDLVQLFGTVLRFVSEIKDYNMKCKKRSEFVINILRYCESKIEKHFSSIIKIFPEILDGNIDDVGSPIGNDFLCKHNEALSPNNSNLFLSYNNLSEKNSVSKSDLYTDYLKHSCSDLYCDEEMNNIKVEDIDYLKGLFMYYWCLIDDESYFIKVHCEDDLFNLSKYESLTIKKRKGCYLFNNFIHKNNALSSILLSFNIKNDILHTLDFFNALKILSLNIGICVKVDDNPDVYKHIYSIDISSILDRDKPHSQNYFKNISILNLSRYKSFALSATNPNNQSTSDFTIIWSIDVKNDEHKCILLIEICDCLSIHITLDDGIIGKKNDVNNANTDKYLPFKHRKHIDSKKCEVVNRNSKDSNVNENVSSLYPTICFNNKYFDLTTNVLVLSPSTYYEKEKSSLHSAEELKGSKTISKRNSNVIKRQSGAPKRVTRLRPSGADAYFVNQVLPANDTTLSSVSPNHSGLGSINHNNIGSSQPPNSTSFASFNIDRSHSDHTRSEGVKSRKMNSTSTHKRNMYRKCNSDCSIVSCEERVSKNKESRTGLQTHASKGKSKRWSYFPTIKSIKKLSQNYNLSGKFLTDYLGNITSFIYKRFSI